MLTTPAGAGSSPAPASFSLRPPTFGDWVDCGEIETTLFVADPFADADVAATMEFSVDPKAVADWFVALTDKPLRDIQTMPWETGKQLYRDLQKLVPSFTTAQADGTTESAEGIKVALKVPITGTRGPINEILLRHPLVGDFIACGNPSVQRVGVEDDTAAAAPKKLEQRIDRAAVLRWLVALTGQPIPILSQMDYLDARRVYAALRRMLAGLDVGNS